MFSYTIAKEADNVAFEKACERIEAKIENIQKCKLLIDVDGTLIQKYEIDSKKIKVVNDYEVDAVYVEAEISLDDIFER